MKASELIRSVETSARGPYGGAIGWIAGDGSMDSAVVIRSALVRGGVAEAAETRAKASAMLEALGAVA